MKKKISILLLCMLLSTPLCLAQTATPLRPQTTSADVPVWSVNNYWTYRIDNLTVNVEQENFSLSVYLSIADFTTTVIAETNDTYQLQISSTAITGNFALYTMTADGPVNVSGTLKKTTLGGTISIAKADIGVKAMNLVLKGKLVSYIHEQPYLPRLPARIPFSMTMNSDIAFDTPYTLLTFPLNESSVWGLPASKVTLSGTIDSPWFSVINRVNHFIRTWNLIGPVANMTGMTVEETQHISDVLYDILPTVDIAHVMNTYLHGNSINITATPELFYCTGTESVTVPAGTFTAYNISLFGGLGYMYYAPEAGHIIKTTGQFANISAGMVSNLAMELKATNYQP